MTTDQHNHFTDATAPEHRTEHPQLSLGGDVAQVLQQFNPIFQRIAEGALAREQQRLLPYEPIQWLKEQGFGALRVPVQYGGAGLSIVQLVSVLTELGKADSNVLQALRGHFAFVEDRLNAHQTADQSIWFARFVQGDLVGNAWTEIGSVQIGDVNTRVSARADGSLWVNGEKYYATGTIFADWIDLFAWDDTRQEHVIAAISRHADGVQVHDDWDGFGQTTTGSGTLLVENVPITRDHILPFAQRFRYQTAFYQLVHLATLTGIAQAAVQHFKHEVQQRKRIFSHGNADLVRHDAQVLQVIGEASAQAYASLSTTLQVAARLQQAYESHFFASDAENVQVNNLAELASAQGQVVIAYLVLDLTSKLFNALSASASSNAKQLDRYWRNARVVSSHNPIIYKAKAIGDWEVNRAPLPFVWQIGASPQAKSA